MKEGCAKNSLILNQFKLELQSATETVRKSTFQVGENRSNIEKMMLSKVDFSVFEEKI
jgi:hypothetical protein